MKQITLFYALIFTSFYCSFANTQTIIENENAAESTIQSAIQSTIDSTINSTGDTSAEDTTHDDASGDSIDDTVEHDEGIPTVAIDNLDLFGQETPMEEYARQLINLMLNVLADPSTTNKEALNAYVAHYLTRQTAMYDVVLNLTITPRTTFPTYRHDEPSSHKHARLMRTRPLESQAPEATQNTPATTQNTVAQEQTVVVHAEREVLADGIQKMANSVGEILRNPEDTKRCASTLVDMFLNLIRMGATIVLADS